MLNGLSSEVESVSDDFSVIKVVLDSLDNLVVFVTLAGNENYISGLCY